MKRKAMLMNKLQGPKSRQYHETIALLGIRRGVGVTYTGLSLAFYMGEVCGKKTAFIECNKHHDMELIQKAYDWNLNVNCFTYHNITCFKDVQPESLPQLLGEDFEVIIIDFGIDFDLNLSEFLRCNYKIILSGSAQWDIQKMNQVMHRSNSYRGSDSWLYFVPQASNKTVINIRKELNRNIWAVPAIENPIFPSVSASRFFRQIFD